MKIYVKQKFFSLKDRFTIFDDNQEDMYIVEGEWFSLKRKLTIFNPSLEPLAHLSQQLFKLTSHVDVSIINHSNFTIAKRFTLINQKYNIEGDTWHVSGDFFGHEYQILDGDQVVATISKAWLTLSDFYEVNILDMSDALKVLSVVLAIDIAMIPNAQN
jgi:uncharacterized protein YxjI